MSGRTYATPGDDAAKLKSERGDAGELESIKKTLAEMAVSAVPEQLLGELKEATRSHGKGELLQKIEALQALLGMPPVSGLEN